MKRLQLIGKELDKKRIIIFLGNSIVLHNILYAKSIATQQVYNSGAVHSRLEDILEELITKVIFKYISEKI